ncbi:MAG: beta-lactamase family protein [Desmonostoc vinosum HA7617-LM4]|nr:beta-lactamase family protein [Desmonostoc vinosum HA7617-LM4]
METLIKPLFWELSIAAIAIVVLIFGFYLFRQYAIVAIAYKAKILCSGVFVSQRDAISVQNQDLLVDDLALLKYISAEINYQEQSVTTSVFGLIKRKAIFRPGLGCTLVNNFPQEKLLEQQTAYPQPDKLDLLPKLVETEDLNPGIDIAKLNTTVDIAFSEPNPNRLGRTRAVVVIYDGHIVAERYAEGFSSDTPLIGWSMTKSVINALIGILVYQGKLSLSDNKLLPEWSQPGDLRQDITLDQLLRMSSGLKFTESYTNLLEDCTIMLFNSNDAASYAANKLLEAKPDTKWYYSSGTTNILSRIIRNTVGEADYFAFPRRALFNRIGMHSAILEPDASGTFVGSSFMYATARDWAKFGWLYLQDGEWYGERILPEGWVKYSTTPTPSDPKQRYGAHFWLKFPPMFASTQVISPPLANDMYIASGHQAQFLTMIPSHKLVVVRLGLSQLPQSWDQEWFISQLQSAVLTKRESPHIGAKQGGEE